MNDIKTKTMNINELTKELESIESKMDSMELKNPEEYNLFKKYMLEKFKDISKQMLFEGLRRGNMFIEGTFYPDVDEKLAEYQWRMYNESEDI